MKDEAMSNQNVSFKKKYWFLEEKYKRENALIKRVKKELLKVRMGDFWARINIKYNKDLEFNKNI